jgi:hypothetical protein
VDTQPGSASDTMPLFQSVWVDDAAANRVSEIRTNFRPRHREPATFRIVPGKRVFQRERGLFPAKGNADRSLLDAVSMASRVRRHVFCS